ncbi:MAG: hypothetical protein HKP61_12350 [Dactylosporangium sp.]|nr:hypothetical protein [Dactylosporangium sp.]NNJ61710.1 hypothetical protein [Dactylosporangium sp.]
MAYADIGELVVVAGGGVEVPTSYGDGSVTSDNGDGGPATEATVIRPEGMAVAPDGTLYICEVGPERVRAVSPSGIITTVAGPGKEPRRPIGAARPGVPMPDGQPGTETYLYDPRFVAVGPDGTLYIADEWYRVLALSPDGRMSVLAGTGTAGFSSDGGPARQAALAQVSGLGVAPDGTVYIGDIGSRRLRAVSPEGIITTVAGNGTADYEAAHAGKDATRVSVPGPKDPVVDRDGDVWFNNSGNLLRLSDGALATVTRPEPDQWGLTTRRLDVMDPTVDFINAMAVGPDGVYLFNANSEVLRLGAGNIVETIARTDVVFASLAVGPGGEVYIADFTGDRVLMFRPPPVGSRDVLPSWQTLVQGGMVLGILLVLGNWLVRRRIRSRAEVSAGADRGRSS